MLLSALGIAIVAPLALMPASAGFGSSGMFVHAWDTSEPEIEAVAGMTGMSKGGLPNPVGPGEGSGDPGVTPGSEDTSAKLLSFGCGPMTVNITQDMVDFSKKNEELYSSGRSSEMTTYKSEGWSIISSYVAGQGIFNGVPADGSIPQVVFFAKGYYNTADMKVYAEGQRGSQCRVSDNRAALKDGLTIGYSYYSPREYTESRVLQESDGLHIVSAGPQGDQFVISRTSSDGSRIESERYPEIVSRYADGKVSLNAMLPREIDGYNYVELRMNGDGSGDVSYSNMGEGANSATRPIMKNGPATIWFDAGEKIREVAYYENGVSPIYVYAGDESETFLQRFRDSTGADWDGNYWGLSNFDVSDPFVVTKP